MNKKAGQQHGKNIRQPQKKTVEQITRPSWQPVGGEDREGLPVIRPLVAGHRRAAARNGHESQIEQRCNDKDRHQSKNHSYPRHARHARDALEDKQIEANRDQPRDCGCSNDAERGFAAVGNQAQHESGDQAGKDPTARIRPTQPDDRRVNIEIGHGGSGIEREVPGHEAHDGGGAGHQKAKTSA